MTTATGNYVRATVQRSDGTVDTLSAVFVGVDSPPTRQQWSTIMAAVDGVVNHAGGDKLLSVEATGAFTVVTMP